jgi:hypothetical protein
MGKNQTSQVCANPSAFDLALVDPSIVTSPSPLTMPKYWALPTRIYLTSMMQFDMDFWVK